MVSWLGCNLTSAALRATDFMIGFHGFWLFSAIRLLLDLQVRPGKVLLRTVNSGNVHETHDVPTLDKP